MAVRPTYPGVYVQEVPSGVRTISGVSTSVALFIGFTKSGPVDKPSRCFSYTDYVRAYGEDTTAGDMTRQVKLAFLNGLTEAYVLRVADGALPASVQLRDVGDNHVLTLTARHPGSDGGDIRVAIDYDTDHPESTFNMTVFRWVEQPNGTFTAQGVETWSGLSMDPNSPSNAAQFLQSNSKLVTAAEGAGILANTAASFAMNLFDSEANAETDWGSNVAGGWISLSIHGSRYVDVQMPAAQGDYGDTLVALQQAIVAAFDLAGESDPTAGGFSVAVENTAARVTLGLLSTSGDVRVRPAQSGDVTAHLRLGAQRGGLEIGRFASARPVPNGVTISALTTANVFGIESAASVGVTINKYDAEGEPSAASPGTELSFGLADPAHTRLEALRDYINTTVKSQAGPGESFPWVAEIWGVRLAIVPIDGPIPNRQDDNREAGFALATWTPATTRTIRHYSVGSTGLVSPPAASNTFQSGGVAGNDGTAPANGAVYEAAYRLVEEQVDLFNLLILPRSKDNRTLVDDLWSAASVFAEQQRALLLMEPPEDWKGVQVPAEQIGNVRAPVSKQYAALYYPRLELREGKLTIPISPVGAVAGVMARTDNARGVWKAPAGTEAGLRGISGLEQRLSDPQNGALNPLGINCVRHLPDGFVVWGARTLDGYDSAGSEYKYVPIRRLANFIEESLFRGLRWVVFEPNDEPLWAQIRLNVGAFMHDLFRKGAFQGTKPQDAYFVRCDSETTTSTDQNLGIVNVWVGFAPLKPAEFVVISLQQMAGQSEV